MKRVVLTAVALACVTLTTVQAAWAETTTICVPESPSKPVLSTNAKGECPPKGAKPIVYKAVQLPGTGGLELLNTVLAHINYVESGIGGKPTIQFSGVNLQLVNGEGKTHSVNGEGNLVIGYDENTGGHQQSGSHDLVLGEEQTFTSVGDFLAGYRNTVTAPFGTISGGAGNTVSSDEASVAGGFENAANGQGSSVSGGRLNEANNLDSSVDGGGWNRANGQLATVSGGGYNQAGGNFSSVSGGWESTAGGPYSSVSGGGQNHASEYFSAVSGGLYGNASGFFSAVSGVTATQRAPNTPLCSAVTD
jgi:hypothetical protein